MAERAAEYPAIDASVFPTHIAPINATQHTAERAAKHSAFDASVCPTYVAAVDTAVWPTQHCSIDATDNTA